MAKKARRGFINYKSYSFVDKDPIIDVVRTAVSDTRAKYSDIEEKGGPKASTVRNWLHGNTRRPHFCTVAAALNALGVGFTMKGGKPKLLKNGD